MKGDDSDGGRLTSKPLAQWLGTRRDNDVKVVVHGNLVSLGSVYYDSKFDIIILVPLDDEDLRIAMAHCPDDVERP